MFTSDFLFFYSCVFQSFSIAITSLGEERANLCAFRTFVRFALVWFCLFHLPLGNWEGLRFVIMALPGLFSYLFYYICHCMSLHVCPDKIFIFDSRLANFWERTVLLAFCL